jgi:hypothetical protein
MRHESDFSKPLARTLVNRHSAIHAWQKRDKSINGQSHVFGYGPASYSYLALLTLWIVHHLRFYRP